MIWKVYNVESTKLTMMMRAESSILGLNEIVGGVAIAAAVREIADSSCLLHASRARERCWEPGSHGL